MTTRTLTEQLVRTEVHTDEDGRAIAEITDIPYRADGELHVPLEVLTTGERVVETFEVPKVWSEEYGIVRLLEELDYGAGGLELLEGERVPLERRDGAWMIALAAPHPEPERTHQRRTDDRPPLPPWIEMAGQYTRTGLVFLTVAVTGALFAATSVTLALALAPSSPVAVAVLLFFLLAASHPRPRTRPYYYHHHSLVPATRRAEEQRDPRRR